MLLQNWNELSIGSDNLCFVWLVLKNKFYSTLVNFEKELLKMFSSCKTEGFFIVTTV